MDRNGRTVGADAPEAGGFLPAHRRLVPEVECLVPRGRLFFLHGFFGSGRNWSAIARGVMRARPDWESVLVDLRLHGDSRDAPPPHDIETCAQDVARLATALPVTGGPLALLGHSFGGKVVLEACAQPQLPCDQVWVIDSTPAPRTTGAGARRLLELLERLPDSFPSRRDGADAVEAGGFPRFIAEWVATNLDRDGDLFRWRFDFTELRMLLEDFYRTDLWPVVERPPADAELRFVRATENSIMSDEDAARIDRLESEGATVRLQHLEGGHWLNVANPDGIIALLRSSLPRN